MKIKSREVPLVISTAWNPFLLLTPETPLCLQTLSMFLTHRYEIKPMLACSSFLRLDVLLRPFFKTIPSSLLFADSQGKKTGAI